MELKKNFENCFSTTWKKCTVILVVFLRHFENVGSSCLSWQTSFTEFLTIFHRFFLKIGMSSLSLSIYIYILYVLIKLHWKMTHRNCKTFTFFRQFKRTCSTVIAYFYMFWWFLINKIFPQWSNFQTIICGKQTANDHIPKIKRSSKSQMLLLCTYTYVVTIFIRTWVLLELQITISNI